MKVPYVEDNATQGGQSAPSETEVSRMIRSEVETWKSRRGPDWSELMVRIAAAGPAPFGTDRAFAALTDGTLVLLPLDHLRDGR